MRTGREGEALKESPLSIKEAIYGETDAGSYQRGCVSAVVLISSFSRAQLPASASQVLSVNPLVPARGKHRGKVPAAAIVASSTCVSSGALPWRIIFYILR